MPSFPTAEAVIPHEGLDPRAASPTESPPATMLLVDLAGHLSPDGETGTDPRILLVNDGRSARAKPSAWLAAEAFVATPIDDLCHVDRIVFLLPDSVSTSCHRVIDHCAALAAATEGCRVCLVTSFSAHFDDRRTAAMETTLRTRFDRVTLGHCTVVRPGNVLAWRGWQSSAARWFAAVHPLVSARFRSCFLDDGELFAAIQNISAEATERHSRTFTLLGQNRALSEVLAERAPRNPVALCLTGLAHLFRWLLIGHLISMVFRLLARWRPTLRRWQCDTLEPTTPGELLALYNPFNRQHVALAGYNTGVTHFGWKFPGRTVVKTIGTGKRLRLRARDEAIDVDAGVTLKRVIDELHRAGRQLYVVPNYSYISMGTIFLVPVHGSGSDVSTLGDTIEQALVYDPASDRFLVVKRGEERFGHFMYNPQSEVLVLRLRFRIRRHTQYVMRQSKLESPTADDLWRVFADPTASNIELRKAGSAATAVDVNKFFSAPIDGETTLGEAKDSLGRLWDRLEENPITSFLFHGLTRWFLYHVELFLDEREFGVFWNAHTQLKLLKIQLRFARRDDLWHSPIGSRDCVSADLVMRRSQSGAFLAFMKDHLPHARFNTGKHSM